MITIELALVVASACVSALCLLVVLLLLVVLALRSQSAGGHAQAPHTGPESKSPSGTYMLSYILITDHSRMNAQVPDSERVHGIDSKFSFKFLLGVTDRTNMLRVFTALIQMHEGTDIVPVSFSPVPDNWAAALPPVHVMNTYPFQG